MKVVHLYCSRARNLVVAMIKNERNELLTGCLGDQTRTLT